MLLAVLLIFVIILGANVGTQKYHVFRGTFYKGAGLLPFCFSKNLEIQMKKTKVICEAQG